MLRAIGSASPKALPGWGKHKMKDPYAPGFWCATGALVLLTATYLYTMVQGHQLAQALVLLDSALAFIGVGALFVLAWCAWQNVQIKKRQETQGHTLVLIWDTKVALRKVETVFDRYFWGSYWQPGRTFAEVMGDLSGTPLDKAVESLKVQCQVLDEELHSHDWYWLNHARELGFVAKTLARQRYLLDFSDPGMTGDERANRELEMLVYSWSARLRAFDHQLDEVEAGYC